MKNFDIRTNSISDFWKWYESEEIVLEPKFQRRNVWNEKARAYLIDTILEGKPIPKLIIRQRINLDTGRTILEVVDGQQRLRSIFAFLEDGLRLKTTANEEYKGLLFSQLPRRIQREFLEYELSVDLLTNASDEEVFDIFARINSYAVLLNQQERLNGQFFGEFKKTAYDLAKEFHTFWKENRILSDRAILRMKDAEIISDLLIAMIDGNQPKRAMKQYYGVYDDSFPDKEKYMKRFRHTMDAIGSTMKGTLATSNFSRVHVFYTLFCSMYHFLYGLPKIKSDRIEINKSDYPKIRTALERIDTIWSREALSSAEREFLDRTRRKTSDGPIRLGRTEFVCQVIFSYLSR